MWKTCFFQVAKDQRGVVCILHISGRSDFPLILQPSPKQLAKVSRYYLLHTRQILAFTDEAARFFLLHSNFLGCTPISGSFPSEQMNPWLAQSRSVC